MNFWGCFFFCHLVPLSLLLVKHLNTEDLLHLLSVYRIRVGTLHNQGWPNSALGLSSHREWFRETTVWGWPISIILSSWLAYRTGLSSGLDWCNQSESWDSCRSYVEDSFFPLYFPSFPLWGCEPGVTNTHERRAWLWKYSKTEDRETEIRFRVCHWNLWIKPYLK